MIFSEVYKSYVAIKNNKMTLPDKREKAVEDKLVPLSEKEKCQFDKFIKELEILEKEDKCGIFYRGVDSKSFWYKLNRIYGKTSGLTQHDKLFILAGEKAKTYLSKNYKKAKNKKYFKGINDCDKEIFHYIFDELHDLFTKKLNDNRVKKFTLINKDFAIFFKDYKNKKILFNKLKNSPNLDYKEKLTIRDYYLYLLHTTLTLRKTNFTYFVSSTSDIKEAKRFSSNPNGGIVCCMFYSKPLVDYGVSRETLSNVEDLLVGRRLPIYEGEIFPNQKELMIRGAIFPHHLLGYIDTKRNSFIINSNFPFSEIENIEDNDVQSSYIHMIIKYGFEIDQSNFHQFINNTDYVMGIQRCHNGIYSEIKIKNTAANNL